MTKEELQDARAISWWTADLSTGMSTGHEHRRIANCIRDLCDEVERLKRIERKSNELIVSLHRDCMDYIHEIDQLRPAPAKIRGHLVVDFGPDKKLISMFGEKYIATRRPALGGELWELTPYFQEEEAP